MRFPLPSRWFQALEFCQLINIINMGISSKFCYMQKADIYEILTPPRTLPESSILVRNIVIIEFLGLTGNRIIETGNGIILTN